jgi:uncharacterized protein (TIGR02598 family)
MKKFEIRGSDSDGFSLPETALAVAIASLGLLAIMGLLPQGLELSRKTGNLAAETRIVQQISGEVQQVNWSEQTTAFPVGNTPNRYYDDQGVSVDGTETLRIAYVARVEVPAETDSSVSAVTMPGSKDNKAHPFLRRLVVKVASVPSTSFDFGPNNKARYSMHSFLIAKTN